MIIGFRVITELINDHKQISPTSRGTEAATTSYFEFVLPTRRSGALKRLRRINKKLPPSMTKSAEDGSGTNETRKPVDIVSAFVVIKVRDDELRELSVPL